MGAAVTSKVRPEAMVFERADADHLVARRFLNRGEKVRVADAVDQRRIQARSAKQQTVHAPIGPLHASVDIDRNHRVLHAVEKSFQLALAGLNASVTFLHPARRLIECRRHLPDLVRRSGSDSGGQIPAGHALGKIYDPLQTPAHILRSGRRHHHRENESGERSPEQRHGSGRSVISISGNGYASRTAPPETGAATYTKGTPRL